MSTTPTTPEIQNSVTQEEHTAAFAMPMDELKSAAFAANRAVLEAPETPQEAKPVYEVKNGPDGVQIHLETGEVYKGKSESEAWGRLAESKAHQSRYIRQLNEFKNKYEAWKKGDINLPSPSMPQQPVFAPELTPEQEHQLAQEFSQDFFSSQFTPEVAKNVGEQALAQVLNVPVDALPNVINDIQTVTRNFQLETTYLDFQRSCQDYMETPQNMQAVLKYLNPQPNSLPTSQDLLNAWALAVYTGEAQPAPRVDPLPPRPAPPVMPSNMSPTASEPDAWKMPINELRQAVQRGGY
ncbi:MAG TPA: PepSY domain-containing protein [Terriglobales bacterium]|nr:PepSY domain-containing protein [Terriglobales bacterium]